jgi:hypothetical protein
MTGEGGVLAKGQAKGRKSLTRSVPTISQLNGTINGSDEKDSGAKYQAANQHLHISI